MNTSNNSSSKPTVQGKLQALMTSLFLRFPKDPNLSVRQYANQLYKNEEVIELTDGGKYTAETIRSYYYRVNGPANPERDLAQYKTEDITTDKEVKEVDWRTIFKAANDYKQVLQSHSKSATDAIWSIKTNKPICIVNICDSHIGSWGTDHDLVQKVIEEIVNTPNLYVILSGDLIQMAIKMRSVAEVSDNLLPPKWQYKVLESIMKEIKHKVIAATWCNHAVEREEKQIGYSPTAMMLEDNVIYFNGIGHLQLNVGRQTYHVAVSHLFRGRSMYNPTHGQMRYLRDEAPWVDVCLAGDSHVPGLLTYTSGGKTKVAINGGSTQTSSSYAQRYFSLKTHPVFPCFTLDPKDHQINTYWSVKQWLNR
jgi:hypothetical protein